MLANACKTNINKHKQTSSKIIVISFLGAAAPESQFRTASRSECPESSGENGDIRGKLDRHPRAVKSRTNDCAEGAGRCDGDNAFCEAQKCCHRYGSPWHRGVLNVALQCPPWFARMKGACCETACLFHRVELRSVQLSERGPLQLLPKGGMGHDLDMIDLDHLSRGRRVHALSSI